MRKILITTFILLLFPFGQAQAHGDNKVSINEALEGIFKSQGVAEIKQIDCQKVTDEQFEQMGETFMDAMHPGLEQHEAMDQMMGGEVSLSLKTAHIVMGQRYLGCSDSRWGNNGAGMMSWGGQRGNYSMMGGYSPMTGWFGFGLGWVVMVLFLVLIVVAIIALIRWLINQGVDKKN
ncbi:MAG: hypothetical protein AAB673_03635 [Patescibacteria group bacterium]